MPTFRKQRSIPPALKAARFVDTPCAALKTDDLGQGTNGADA